MEGLLYPPGATTHAPPEQTHTPPPQEQPCTAPPEQPLTPPQEQTPPGPDPTPPPTPPGKQTPAYIYERPVRILLECILVLFVFVIRLIGSSSPAHCDGLV